MLANWTTCEVRCRLFVHLFTLVLICWQKTIKGYQRWLFILCSLALFLLMKWTPDIQSEVVCDPSAAVNVSPYLCYCKWRLGPPHPGLSSRHARSHAAGWRWRRGGGGGYWCFDCPERWRSVCEEKSIMSKRNGCGAERTSPWTIRVESWDRTRTSHSTLRLCTGKQYLKGLLFNMLFILRNRSSFWF